MNENDCSILVVLDRERNMTKAASKLFISQPALTYRLRQIEKNFNIQIFEREKSGLIPTPEGELIVQYARDNLQQLATTLEKDRKSTRLNSSHVAISYAVFSLKNKKR